MFSPEDLIFPISDLSVLDFAEGEFARRVWILALAEPEISSNRDFLSKVLLAANLNLQKDTLFAELPDSEMPVLLPAFRQKQPEQVLVFGILPQKLGLAIEAPLYRPIIFYGVNWLFADALSVLEPDKNKKSQLWSALKQMFL